MSKWKRVPVWLGTLFYAHGHPKVDCQLALTGARPIYIPFAINDIDLVIVTQAKAAHSVTGNFTVILPACSAIFGGI